MGDSPLHFELDIGQHLAFSFAGFTLRPSILIAICTPVHTNTVRRVVTCSVRSDLKTCSPRCFERSDFHIIFSLTPLLPDRPSLIRAPLCLQMTELTLFIFLILRFNCRTKRRSCTLHVFKKCPRCGQSMRRSLASSLLYLSLPLPSQRSQFSLSLVPVPLHTQQSFCRHTSAKYQRADLTCNLLLVFKCSVCGVVALPHLLWATNILLQSHFRGTFRMAFFLWLGSCCSPVNTHRHTKTDTRTRQTHACKD